MATHEEEPEELSEEEAQEISDEASLEAVPTPPHPHRRVEEPEDISHDELEEADAEPVEASDDELEEADAVEAADADELEEADAEPVEASDELPEADAHVEAIEAPDDQVQEADDAVEPVGDEPAAPKEPLAAKPAPAPAPAESPLPAPPDSALDPWFAQLAHGYCPPEGAQFARHTPPTNFPGRDEEPTDPSRVPPNPLIQGTSRGKSS